MNKILEKLYLSYIKEQESQISPGNIPNPENEQEVKLYEKLCKTFSKEQNEIFQKFIDLVDDQHDAEEEKAYQDGFTAGALLMIEIFYQRLSKKTVALATVFCFISYLVCSFT